MPDHKLCVPCLFGLEGPLGNELRHMGLRDVMPENGRVRCTGTDADIARMNIRCRFGERVLLELGSFPAPTFDALFEGVKALPWADYLPADAAFPVKGYSLESALHSVPDNGKLEFLVVRDVSRLQFIRLVGKYAKGRYRELEQFITHLEGDHLEIDSENEIVVNIDGEALYSKHVNFDLIPGGVNFLVPANMAFFHPETAGGHETREFVHT